jgi:hypothetical protein
MFSARQLLSGEAMEIGRIFSQAPALTQCEIGTYTAADFRRAST